MESTSLAYASLVSVTYICSLFHLLLLIAIVYFSSSSPCWKKYQVDRKERIFRLQVALLSIGLIASLLMNGTSLLREQRSNPMFYQNDFSSGNLLCSVGFRVGSFLFVFHLLNYLFLMTKANAANTIPSSQILGKLLKLCVYSVPLFAIIAAVFNAGKFDSDVSLGIRTQEDYYCVVYVPWQVAVGFGIMDTLLELGFFVYFMLPLWRVLKTWEQIRVAFQYNEEELDAAEKARRKSRSAEDTENSRKKRKLIAVAVRNFSACCISVVSTVGAVLAMTAGSSSSSVYMRMMVSIVIPLNMICCSGGTMYATSGAWQKVKQDDSKVVEGGVSTQQAKPKSTEMKSESEARTSRVVRASMVHKPTTESVHRPTSEEANATSSNVTPAQDPVNGNQV